MDIDIWVAHHQTPQRRPYLILYPSILENYDTNARILDTLMQPQRAVRDTQHNTR